MRADTRIATGTCTLILGLLASACTSRHPIAAGSLSDVTLLVDRDRPGARALRAALEVPVEYVGAPEPLFHVDTVHDFGADARYARTLIVLAALDAPDAAARTARQLLGPSRCDSLRHLGSGILEFGAVHARGQRVMVLAAAADTALDSLATARAGELRAWLEASAEGRCREDLLRDGSGDARARALAGTFGFELHAPASYRTRTPDGAWSDAVELVQSGPTRALTVFWLDGVDAAQARDAGFVTGFERDALWRLHGDTLVEERTRVQSAWLGPYPALRLDGVWQNRTDIGGGPIVTHFVHDPRRQRLYGVQGLLYAPGTPKHPWMRELHALASTFRVEGPG